MAFSVKIMVFRDVMPFSLVGRYPVLRRNLQFLSFRVKEDGGSSLLWNSGISQLD